MRKGKLGIILPFYGVLGFLLAILGQTFLCGLLMGLVLIIEKDEITGKAVIQAFVLSLFGSLISLIFSAFDPIISIPVIGAVVGTIVGIVEGIFGLIVLIFGIIGIVKAKKDIDPAVPLVNKFSNWAYGTIVQKVIPQYQQPAQPYQQPMQQQPQYQQPVQPQQQYQQPMQQPQYQQPVQQQQPLYQPPTQQPLNQNPYTPPQNDNK